MTDDDPWQTLNDAYVATALARLRRRFEPDSAATPPPADTPSAMVAAPSAKGPPFRSALEILTERLGLSAFERDVLFLCAAVEFDPHIAALCAQAQGDPHRPYPTFALALSLFDEPRWDVLSPHRPLRLWRLIEINQPGAQPLTTSALRADERIVNYIKGLNYLDDRLTTFLLPCDTPADDAELPDSHQEAVSTIVRHLQQPPVNARLPLIQLLGADSCSKRLVAQHAAAALGLLLYRLPAGFLPPQAADVETFARLWQRESVLLPIALYLETEDESSPPEAHTAALHRLLARSSGVLFLDTREVSRPGSVESIALDIGKPTTAEQQAAWTTTLGAASGSAPKLAAQFDLSLPNIFRIARAAHLETEQRPPDHDSLWQTCLVHTRPRLDALAQRIEPKATWETLELPAEEKELLRAVCAQVRYRRAVYETWGFGEHMNRGLGISVLFAGESGTGKTMAAEVIANDLPLNLYRIDLSAVVSKYIGETEKNLRRLFDAAEDGGAILFFDEADALFGKRSEVKDSHDRYANIEINYLLQRIEAYRGLAILATNQKSALDTAFTRRLRFAVNFPHPGPTERKAIWRKAFPAWPPDLDVERLSRLNLTGGSITNVAMNAAFLAARAGTQVTMPLVLKAARIEFRKLERPVNENDFRWLEPAAAVKG
jgi:hypothetical protein